MEKQCLQYKFEPEKNRRGGIKTGGVEWNILFACERDSAQAFGLYGNLKSIDGNLRWVVIFGKENAGRGVGAFSALGKEISAPNNSRPNQLLRKEELVHLHSDCRASTHYPPLICFLCFVMGGRIKLKIK